MKIPDQMKGNVTEKKDYVTPQLFAYGSIVTLTQSATDGDHLDAAFAAGTPRGDITFS
jgi:hypothetical protein